MCRALLLLCLCILPCCTTGKLVTFEGPPADQEALASLVCKVELQKPPRRSGGSAVKIGANRLLTARHVLPEHAFRLTIPGDGELAPRLQTVPAWIDGTLIGYRVLDAGEEGNAAQDWAVIEVEGIDLPMPDELTVEFDFERQVEPGEKVLLVGFLKGSQRVIVPAMAVDPPPGTAIAVDTGGHMLNGLSGGPALLWNPEERHAVVVGICRGWTASSFFLGIPLARIVELVRPPWDP